MIVAAQDADFAIFAEGGRVGGRRLADGGIAPESIMQMLRGLASKIRPACDPAAWWMVEDDEIVGLCSITAGPGENATIDIGYGVAEVCRGRGVATRAICEVLTWAAGRPDIDAVTAETSVDNPASQRVLERNGFVRVGTRIDVEDGDLICWRATTMA